jgi:hypothetical protein
MKSFLFNHISNQKYVIKAIERKLKLFPRKEYKFKKSSLIYLTLY